LSNEEIGRFPSIRGLGKFKNFAIKVRSVKLVEGFLGQTIVSVRVGCKVFIQIRRLVAFEKLA